MNEADWLNSTDPQPMLEFLRTSGKASERKLELFAAACCRRVWHLLFDQRSRKAVEVAEAYADERARREALAAAGEAARAAATAVAEEAHSGSSPARGGFTLAHAHAAAAAAW